MIKTLAIAFLSLISIRSLAQDLDTFEISGTYVSEHGKMPFGTFKFNSLSNGPHKLTFGDNDHDSNDTVLTINGFSIRNVHWVIRTNCSETYNRQAAYSDIKQGKAILFLNGSFSRYKGDDAFSKKYCITFGNFGDIIIAKRDCMLDYNLAIFEYLDSTFGTNWRKEIRPDIIGL